LVAVKKHEEDYIIKPEAVTPSVDTSSWPLLLKNYNNRMNSASIVDIRSNTT
jgi:H/ACA ribonucleoprotein complex subunit 4